MKKTTFLKQKIQEHKLDFLALTTTTISYLTINLLKTIKRFHITILHRLSNCSISDFIQDFDKLSDNQIKKYIIILV